MKRRHRETETSPAAGLKNQRGIRKPRTFADGNVMNHHLRAIHFPKIKRARIEAQMRSFSAPRKCRDMGAWDTALPLGRKLARMATRCRNRLVPSPRLAWAEQGGPCGRANGLEMRFVSLGALSHKDWCKKISNEASEWRSFRKCFAHAAGQLVRRKGRAGMSGQAFQHLKSSVPQLILLNLQPDQTSAWYRNW